MILTICVILCVLIALTIRNGNRLEEIKNIVASIEKEVISNSQITPPLD